MEGEEHFVPLEVLDDAEVDNGVFFFRIVQVAVFTPVGVRSDSTSGAFAAAWRTRILYEGREVEVTAGRRRGRGRRWRRRSEVWYFAEYRPSRCDYIDCCWWWEFVLLDGNCVMTVELAGCVS